MSNCVFLRCLIARNTKKDAKRIIEPGKKRFDMFSDNKLAPKIPVKLAAAKKINPQKSKGFCKGGVSF